MKVIFVEFLSKDSYLLCVANVTNSCQSESNIITPGQKADGMTYY